MQTSCSQKASSIRTMLFAKACRLRIAVLTTTGSFKFPKQCTCLRYIPMRITSTWLPLGETSSSALNYRLYFAIATIIKSYTDTGCAICLTHASVVISSKSWPPHSLRPVPAALRPVGLESNCTLCVLACCCTCCCRQVM